MRSEEVLRDLERFLRGEPNPYVLTPMQEQEITRRFEAATGGIEAVEEMQRELLRQTAVTGRHGGQP
jgi:hypothetical protein